MKVGRILLLNLESQVFNKTVLIFTLLCMNFMVYADSMQGQLAPSFNLQDQSGNTHQLADYQGQWLVVYFYPKNDTTGCTIEAKAFRDNYSTIKAMNADVIGVSLDDAESHQAFIKKYDLPFNLLVDAEKQMSKDYGVDGGMAFFTYAKRQTFVINPEGIIATHFEEVNPSTHADDVIAVLKELQVKLKATEVTVTETLDDGVVYGAQWPTTDQEITSIELAIADSNKFMAENHVISGRVTRVCQKQGCWMVLADGDAFVRVDFNDHAFLIPKNTSGQAQVYGQLAAVEHTAEQLAHYEAEGSGSLQAKSYELIADSVKILIRK